MNDSDVTLFPHTAFKSSFTFDDGEKYRATQQSTHNENYKSYPTPDMEHYTPPKPQISLTQPNLDPKEAFQVRLSRSAAFPLTYSFIHSSQSSYKQSHKGEALSSDDQTTSAPQTTFKSSVAFDDGEKTRTPQKSTQRDNYILHPTPDIEHYTPPKSQISLTQPNIDLKESFQVPPLPLPLFPLLPLFSLLIRPFRARTNNYTRVRRLQQKMRSLATNHALPSSPLLV